ncbi:MAG TPA: HypC/HybG/HupF family hydrogenase formation chaperone [Candidatus Dormibacteraeota bacterium]|nr:HypC/HybG/HupF family hydrogenase formation chaperone [Candidatus Dormibacteraeota bacterium]
MCLAIPARLIEYADDDRHYGRVELGGVMRRVNTSLLRGPDAAEPGDYVLVHVGFALSRVSEEEAKETLEVLRMMDAVFDDEMSQIFSSEALGEGEPSAADPAVAGGGQR